MHDERHLRIDQAIDEMATSLTQGKPSPAMRTAIRVRVEAGARVGPLFQHWGAGLAAGAAALVVVALVWPAREVPEGEAPAARESTVAVAPPIAASPMPAAPLVPPLANATAPPVRAPRTLDVEAAVPAPVQALEITPLGFDTLDVPLIVVDGLSLDVLALQQ